jgi:hypothetical protein
MSLFGETRFPGCTLRTACFSAADSGEGYYLEPDALIGHVGI